VLRWRVEAVWLAQVQAVNEVVNALVSLRDPDQLMAEARALDDVSPVGWLQGIPLSVKDLVATKGVRTTRGLVPHDAGGDTCLSVSVGFGPGGLQMGMQIIGGSGNDAGVLAFGQVCHRATEWPQRRPPLVADAVSR
jgi:Asp-tRNA(Asn)/Glu-tRNA(Gln) amidotransferase A subunit family amidase